MTLAALASLSLSHLREMRTSIVVAAVQLPPQHLLYAVSTAIFRGLSDSALGKRSVNTPSA